MSRQTKKEGARRRAARAEWTVEPAAQADICRGLVPRGHGERVTLVAVALAYSRASWFEYCAREEDEGPGLLRVLEHAWGFFGGAPRTWRCDMAAAPGRAHGAVEELARRYGAQWLRGVACKPGAAGCGEVALRQVPARLLAQVVLRDLDEANRLLRDFAREHLQRPHPGQAGLSVGDVLDGERGHLLPPGAR